MITISQETKDRISLVNAVKPTGSYVDANIGRKGKLTTGVFAGLEGIIYPPREGVKYLIENSTQFDGSHYIYKAYLILYFFEDGTLFCGTEANFAELDPTGLVKPSNGSGTPADPYVCGSEVSSGAGSSTNYHVIPLTSTAGLVTVAYDMYNITDKMDIYYVTDLTTAVASTVVNKKGKGSLEFYYDPAFNPNKFVVKLNDGGATAGTSWQYEVVCP